MKKFGITQVFWVSVVALCLACDSGPMLLQTVEAQAPQVKPVQKEAGLALIGPNSVQAGSMTIFRAQGLDVKSEAVWAIYPKSAQWVEHIGRDGSVSLFFTTPDKGVYHIVLATVGQTGLQVAEHIVDVGGAGPGPSPVPPGPTPPTPPAPDTLTGLAKEVHTRASKLNDPATAAQYAENIDSVLSAIAAGAFDSYTDVNQRKAVIAKAILDLNTPVTTQKPAWANFWRVEVRELLKTYETAGKMNTLVGIVDTFTELRDGLRAVK